MALAEQMRTLVESIRASRDSRRESTKGLRETTKMLRKENQRFLGDIHDQNQSRAQQAREFLKISKETRRESFSNTMAEIRSEIEAIHQNKEGILEEARAIMKDQKEENTTARKYWMSLSKRGRRTPVEDIKNDNADIEENIEKEEGKEKKKRKK